MSINSDNIKAALSIPVKREWYDCDECGQHLLIVDDTAKCSGVYIKCKRCGKENEIRI